MLPTLSLREFTPPASVQFRSEKNDAFPRKRHQKRHLKFCIAHLLSSCKSNPNRCEPSAPRWESSRPASDVSSATLLSWFWKGATSSLRKPEAWIDCSNAGFVCPGNGRTHRARVNPDAFVHLQHGAGGGNLWQVNPAWQQLVQRTRL